MGQKSQMLDGVYVCAQASVIILITQILCQSNNQIILKLNFLKMPIWKSPKLYLDRAWRKKFELALIIRLNFFLALLAVLIYNALIYGLIWC
jgi:hypothetical protein